MGVRFIFMGVRPQPVKVEVLIRHFCADREAAAVLSQPRSFASVMCWPEVFAYLLPRGTRLIDDLIAIVGPLSDHPPERVRQARYPKA